MWITSGTPKAPPWPPDNPVSSANAYTTSVPPIGGGHGPGHDSPPPQTETKPALWALETHFRRAGSHTPTFLAERASFLAGGGDMMFAASAAVLLRTGALGFTTLESSPSGSALDCVP